MKYCIMIYDLKGKLNTVKYYSCGGCGWKHVPKGVPVCMRERTKDGEMIKKNKLYIDIVERK